MAFRMNRPVIKGTANHKASVAKATQQSIVSQARTTADAALVGAGEALGKSNIGQAIDFSIKNPEIKIDKKELTEAEKAARDAERAERKAARDAKKQARKDKRANKKGNEIKNKTKKVKEKKPKGEGWIKKAGKWVKKKAGEIVSDAKDANQAARDKRYARSKEGKAAKQQRLADAENKRDQRLAERNIADDKAYTAREKQELTDALALERSNEEKLKNRLMREEKEWKRKNRMKKPVITAEPLIVGGVGEQSIADYTKEQLKTIEDGGGTWSDEAGREVLKEEMVDGKYVPLNSGVEILESNSFSGSNQTNATPEPVVEEKKTLSNLEIRKKKRADKKYNDPNTSQYIKDQMLKEGYVPNESKSPANMRDNRIYRNAIKGGVVQQNMIKSGYKPE